LKNFPHQVSDLTKLTAALGVANVLLGAGNAYHDDGVFGEALAKAGIYTFRNKSLSVSQNIKVEISKPIGTQGFRTAARDIRRFFALAGLVQATAVSQRGFDILEAAGQLSLRNALWRDALLRLALPDSEGNISHPYRILLRLVADRPGIETPNLLLALEAKDDGPSEYARVLKLANSSFSKIVASIKIGEANARNAVKLLPSIAEQVGDISRLNGRAYLRGRVTATEDSLSDTQDGTEFEKIVPSDPLEVAPENIAPIPAFANAAASLVDLSASIEIRKLRTKQHHETTVSLAQIIGSAGFKTFANPYDCLGYKGGTGGILLEVKTLDGTRSDERRQSEKALGQLRGYRYFSVLPKMKAPKLIEIVGFSGPPSKATVAFLRESAVCCCWQHNDQWLASDLAGKVTNFSPNALLS
jgi:hypothetical protein